jgi:hypothetical protein
LNRGRLLVAVSCQPSVSLRPAQLAVEQSKLEEIAMANQMIDIDEGSKGGRGSVFDRGNCGCLPVRFSYFLWLWRR